MAISKSIEDESTIVRADDSILARQSFDDYAADSLPRLFRTAYLLTGNTHDAHDLLQDVLERLFLAWWRVRGNPDAYVHRMLVNQGHNRRRWRRRHPETELDPVAQQPEVSDAASAVADRDQVVWALRQLPARQRAVLVLRYFDDLSEREVAEALQISTGTVKSQSAKGVARLRVLLEPSTAPPNASEVVTSHASSGSPRGGDLT